MCLLDTCSSCSEEVYTEESFRHELQVSRKERTTETEYMVSDDLRRFHAWSNREVWGVSNAIYVSYTATLYSHVLFLARGILVSNSKIYDPNILWSTAYVHETNWYGGSWRRASTARSIFLFVFWVSWERYFLVRYDWGVPTRSSDTPEAGVVDRFDRQHVPTTGLIVLHSMVYKKYNKMNIRSRRNVQKLMWSMWMVLDKKHS